MVSLFSGGARCNLNLSTSIPDKPSRPTSLSSGVGRATHAPRSSEDPPGRSRSPRRGSRRVTERHASPAT
eukprot:13068427-Alexandrium_andersonii.AAC.1